MNRQTKGVLGTKLGMSQVFDDEGRMVPVTVVKAGPCVVTAVRTPERDGYAGVQLGYGEIDPRKGTKPVAGHFAAARVTPRRDLAELRTSDASEYTLRQEVTAEGFAPGRAERERGGCGLMKTVSIVSVSGETAGTVELPDEIFGVQANVPLIHQVVVAQQAAARQGTHSARNRGQVRGGGKKPYRQKGTRRARQGSIRAPQYVGGGTVHGPVPRSYLQRTPKKMKAAALCRALSEL